MKNIALIVFALLSTYSSFAQFNLPIIPIYNPPTIPTTSMKFVYNNGWDVEKHPRILFDYNQTFVSGGENVVVGFGDAGTYITRCYANGYTAPQFKFSNYGYTQGWRTEKHPRLVSSTDVDGFPKSPTIVGFKDDLVYVSSNFNQPTAHDINMCYNDGWRVDIHPRMLTTKDDIVGFWTDGVYMSYKTSYGYTPAQREYKHFGSHQGWHPGKHIRMLQNRTYLGQNTIIGFWNDGVYILQPGYHTAPKKVINNFGYNQGWRLDRHPRMLGDINGDGLADIIAFGDAGVYVALGRRVGRNGEIGFHAPTLVVNNQFNANNGWTKEHPRMVADVNGDGKDDIIGFGYQGIWVSYNTNIGFTAPTLVLREYGYNDGWRVDKHPRMIGDFNNNGKADVIGFNYNDVFVSIDLQAPLLSKKADPNNLEATSNYQIKNYPNPFSKNTTIQYELPQTEQVRITVYDVTGQIKALLVNNETKEAGIHKVDFEPNNLAAGMYYYTIQAGTYKKTNKMVINR